MKAGGALRSLRVRNFRLFVSGQAISLTGRWMFFTGQDWLVVRLGGHGVALGTVTAIQFLPMLLLGPWGGLLADRCEKRHLIMWTQSLFAVVATVQAVMVISGTASIVSICVLAGAVGSLAAVDTPARQAFVVEMVGRADITNASALNSVTFNLARIVGPGVAGVLIGAVGEGLVFTLTAVSMAGVVMGLVRMDPSQLQRVELLVPGKGQLREGLAYLRRRSDLMLVVTMVAAVSSLGLNFPVTLALMARQELHGGAEAYGLLGSSLALGSLVAAGFATRRTRPRQRTLVLGAFSFGVAESVAGLMPSLLSFAIALVFVGGTIITFTTTCIATVQLGVDGPLRGRVMSIYLMVFLGSTPIGAPIIGWICQQWGPRSGLLVGGISSILTAAAGALWITRHRPPPAQSWPTTQSMEAVSASTSAGSMDGNIATRS